MACTGTIRPRDTLLIFLHAGLDIDLEGQQLWVVPTHNINHIARSTHYSFRFDQAQPDRAYHSCRAELDLVLEGQRMFFHKATGRYGLINLTLSGDMDLNPVGGEYRFSSKIQGVEINQLMLTLKARPPPYPVAGVLKGDFYCQGALDAPVFSGHVRASAADVSRAVDSVDPPTFASAALRDAPGAVGAYDHVPFESAVGSFDFDTDTCVSHSLSEI